MHRRQPPRCGTGIPPVGGARLDLGVGLGRTGSPDEAQAAISDVHFNGMDVRIITVRRIVALAALAALATLSEPDPGAAQGTPFACPGAAFVVPTSGVVGWSYRWPTGGGTLHTGVDVFGARGDAIYAAEAGPVLSADDRRVRIRHAALGVDTYYTHLERVYVRTGDRVARGQLIGEKGDKGADLVQLHFSVTRVPSGAADWLWLDEREIANTLDPSPYLGANVDYDAGATDHGRRTIAERCGKSTGLRRTYLPLDPRWSRL